MYKFWKLDNIRTETTNNNGDVFVYYLQFEFLNSTLGKDLNKVTVESGDKSSILIDDNSALISPNNKRDIWYYIYELDTPDLLSKVYYKNYNNWGQAWQSADLSFSPDGVNWTLYDTLTTPNLKSTSPVITRYYDIPEDIINNYRSSLKNSYSYWRISNIKNRISSQSYKSVGNISFKTKEDLISNNPSKAISKSYDSLDTTADKAFDGLNTTYALSENIANNDWWIGYNFEKPVELSSIDVFMRYDMEGVVDNITDNSLGQDWTSFQIDGSDNGIDWDYVYSCPEPKIFKNDTSVHSYTRGKIEIFAKYWRISNIKNRLGGSSSSETGSKADGTISELVFITKNGNVSDDPSKAISESFIDTQPNTSASSAFDKNTSTYASSQYISKGGGIHKWWIGYEFENKECVTHISLLPRQDMEPHWGQEWQSFDIEYSDDGESWFFYGHSQINTTQMDLSWKENIPIITEYSNFFEYQHPFSTDNKYKFWRCNNIKSQGSLDNPVDYRSQSILKFINQEELELENKFNSFSSSEYTRELPQGLTINSFDNSKETWSANGFISESNILAAENYSIGCMFNTPVDVYKFGYRPRQNQGTNWGQTWTFCNIQYSPNGFDWYDKGYCEFNIPRGDFSYYEIPIDSLEDLPRYKFWRIKEVYRGISGLYPFSYQGWELRFNTLTGEVSNTPSRGFSTNYWDNTWTPDRAFDGNVSTNAGGFHEVKDNTEPFHIGYEFQTPQYVDSISILMRRDSWYSYTTSNWIYATIESSEDGVDWIHQGYSNLNTDTNTRFYTAKIEDIPATEKLNISEVSSISIESFSKQPLKLFSADNLETNSKFINIYNKNNDGMVTGTVTELGVPVQRLVSLYDRRTRKLVATTWSDKDGVYTFTSIDSTRDYYVHSTDSNNFYDAVTKDMIKPL